MKKKIQAIHDYDNEETSSFIHSKKRLTLSQLGFKLPNTPPTQVVSIRLPTPLLNQIRAKASAKDIPYQALIKLMLSQSLGKKVFA